MRVRVGRKEGKCTKQTNSQSSLYLTLSILYFLIFSQCALAKNPLPRVVRLCKEMILLSDLPPQILCGTEPLPEKYRAKR